MSGPERGRTHARMLRVSTLALCLEGGVGLAALMTVGLSGETPAPGDEGYEPLGLLLLPFAAVLGVLLAFAVSAVLVMPVALLGGDLARRYGGGPGRWQLGLSAVAGMLLQPLGGLWGWLAGTVALFVAALFASRAKQGHFVALLLWGTVAVVAAFTAGAAILYVQD
ncbi:hypothetical protein AB0G79_04310 [Streptomyces sp. NPDC020807]|uniref:hypothetical protein n=1 Tax=Streptomyces sp. NPDC020807 TaxID=3155119 RepID=UPI0033C0D128